MSSKMVRIGIIGTGGMAHSHAEAFSKMRGARIVGACDVLQDRVDAFAKRFHIPIATNDVDDLLDSDDVDAVSIVTPDVSHAGLALQAIHAGKHVLCEKPLAVNYKDAARMARSANREGIVNMVNFSYRRSGALYRARKLVESGRLGEIKHVEASYLQSWLVSKAWGDWRKETQWLWRLSSRHGSRGVLGDIGVHIVDFATFPVGGVKAVNCTLKAFPKAPKNRIGEYRLDANDTAVIHLEFDNGAIGSITATRWATGHANSLSLRIHGDRGALRLELDQDYNKLSVCLGRSTETADWKTIPARAVTDNYQRFVASIRSGKPAEPDFNRGADVQKVLEACFESDTRGGWMKV